MITLADAKLNIRSVPDVTFEDDLIQRLVDSATAYLERRTGWHLGPVDTITAWMCGTGNRVIWLPQPPIDESVSIEDSEGDAVEDFEISGSRLVRSDGVWAYGTDYIVNYDAGFDPGDGPPDLLQATRLLVAGWYEHREAWVAGTIVSDHKQSVDQIAGRYERVRV